MPKSIGPNSEIQIRLSKPIPRPVEFRTTVGIIECEIIWVFADIKGKARVLKGDESGWNEG